jgi:hypothetical protein
VDAALPAWLAGRCRPSLQHWADAELAELLRQAAEIRLERKGQELAARARETGWEQALYEALFAGLGYKHNIWPMRRLAELLPRLQPPGEPLDCFGLHTRLLGVSGLLPGELTHRWPSLDAYLRRAWDLWWREKERFAELGFPPTFWRLHGFRPANHPQRRLALACQWLAAGDLPRRLQEWLTADMPDHRLAGSLLELLQGQADPFWSWHWNLRTARLPQPQPLLGPLRATDLAINVVLPWFWIRAVTGQNEPVRARAERRYFVWRAAEDNAILRLARQRLLGADRRALFRAAAAQQGLLQIERDFCGQSNALCERCPFPDLVARGGPPRES